MEVSIEQADAELKRVALGYENETIGYKGMLNTYKCSSLSCRHHVVTVDRDAGVTSFLIECPKCGASSQSMCYNMPQSLITPTKEWYRPDTLAGVSMNYWPHLLMGGLLLRDTPDVDKTGE